LFSVGDHRIVEAYGAWGEKKTYDKILMGILRSGFLIDETRKIAATGYMIRPKNTISALETWRGHNGKSNCRVYPA